ncbi:hypothetical protein [Elizabethkingia anophelis]|uniref:hypothetical protein n=1 Tax=Elizabethkingia anophelis TaxID=1117645 RepID=UPI0024E1BC55|nr:hypothetical protein [Elizabethkingia anophelis]CAH1145339.1 hypothetical protein EAVVTKC53_01932 [Elizabethkingia anophelis]CAI9679630.1 hypothetical protein EAVVTKC53_01063 [Elizabethkingia anophelis]
MEQQDATPTDGFELLKKVIETNEATIEHYIMLKNSREDIIRMDQKIEETLKMLNETLEKTWEFSALEAQKIQALLDSIPKSIETNLSSKTNMQLEQFEKKSKFVKIVFYGMIAALLFSVFTTTGNIFFAKQWYAESIRSKTEIRQEVLDNIKNNGKSIYKVEDYRQLQHNTELMNKWIEKKPKDAEKFLRFKDGYESR